MNGRREVDNEDVFVARALKATIRIGALLLLVVWCFSIVRPFLVPVVWGIVIAIASYRLYQLLEGLIVTGMNNVFAWALYIMLFVFFVGLSAGGLIISSVPKFFHSDRYDSIAALGVLVSFACIVVAGLLIVPDIGRPERLYRFVTSPDFRSPMVWDFAIVVL